MIEVGPKQKLVSKFLDLLCKVLRLTKTLLSLKANGVSNMGDSNQEPAATATDISKTRNTVSFTHRQLGVGGGVIASLALAAQLKTYFAPVERVDNQDKQIQTIKESTAELKEDFTHKIERSNDKIIERINQLEDRTTKAADLQARRIDSLEADARAASRSHSSKN